MSMEKEELMKPRYKVILTYPLMYFNVGDILTQDTPGGVTGGRGVNMSLETIKEFPHIFRKLEWFEDRKIEDLPEYVKFNSMTTKKYRYWKVSNWGIRDCFNENVLCFDFEGTSFGVEKYHEPSTAAEYQEQNKEL